MFTTKCDLHRAIDGISQKMLTQTLRDLEKARQKHALKGKALGA